MGDEPAPAKERLSLETCDADVSEYPAHLHDAHNDYPLSPEKKG